MKDMMQNLNLTMIQTISHTDKYHYRLFELGKSSGFLKNVNIPIKDSSLYQKDIILFPFNLEHINTYTQTSHSQEKPYVARIFSKTAFIKKKLLSLLDMPIVEQNTSLVQFSKDLFQDNHKDKPYTDISSELQKKYTNTLFKTFDLLLSLKGKANSSFTTTHLLSPHNTLSFYNQEIFLSNQFSIEAHDIDNVANKLYHLIFCPHIPMYGFDKKKADAFFLSNHLVYPDNLESNFHEVFFKNKNTNLKETYFHCLNYLKSLSNDDKGSQDYLAYLSFQAFLLPSHEGECYFLHTWHNVFSCFIDEFLSHHEQALIKSKANPLPSTSHLITLDNVEASPLFFKAKHFLNQLASSYVDEPFFTQITEANDIYYLDTILNSSKKDLLLQNKYAQSLLDNVSNHLHDYPSWISYLYEFHQKNNYWPANHIVSCVNNVVIEELFSPKHKKDHFLLTLISLFNESSLSVEKVPEELWKSIYKHPEQTIFFIDNSITFDNGIIRYYSSLFHKLSQHLHKNDSFHVFNHFFEHLIANNKMDSLLEILSNELLNLFPVSVVLTKNKVSHQWLLEHPIETTQFISSILNNNTQADHIFHFIHNNFSTSQFDVAWQCYLSLFQHDRHRMYISNSNMMFVAGPLFLKISQQFPNEVLEIFEKNADIFEPSLSVVKSSHVQSNFKLQILSIFQQHFSHIQAHLKRWYQFEIRCFDSCVPLFQEKDFLFFQKNLHPLEEIVPLPLFYSESFSKGFLPAEEISDILSFPKSYELHDLDKNFLSLIAKEVPQNKNLLSQLVYLQTPISDKHLEADIFNNPDIYFYFKDKLDNFDAYFSNPALVKYISLFLQNPLFNIDLKEYLEHNLSIENFNTLNYFEIESIIEQYLMRKSVLPATSNEKIRKF